MRTESKFNFNQKPSTGIAIVFALLMISALLIMLFVYQEKAEFRLLIAKAPSPNVTLYSYPNDYQKPISEYYSYLVDTFDHLNVEKAINLRERGLFERWQNPNVPFNLGLKNKEIWFYIPVKNSGQRDVCLVWHLKNTLDTAQLFWKTDNVIQRHKIVSFSTPLKARPVRIRAMFDTIWLHPGEERDLYLRLWKNHYNTYAPMSLSPLPELWFDEGFLSTVYAVYFGIFVFVILLNLFLFISLRDGIHLWYPFFISNVLMILLIDAFYDVFYFPEFLHRLFCVIETLPFADWAMIGTGTVMQLLLQQTRKNSRFYLPLLILFVLDFLWGIEQIVTGFWCVKHNAIYPYHSFHTVSDLLIFATVFFIICSIIEKIIQRHPLAIVYFLTSLLPTFGLINFYLNGIGFAGFPHLYPNSIAVGILLEIIVLTILLTQRYNLLQKEKAVLLKNQLTLQREMSDRVAETLDTEQRRIAADLHDGVGSLLAALRMKVSQSIRNFTEKGQSEPVETLQSVQVQIDKVVDDIRTISHNLMPKDFEQNEFTEVLKNHLNDIISTMKVEVEYHLDPQINTLGKSLQLALYRIFTELLINALKHAHCRHITVQFIKDENYLQMMVEDDGKGFLSDTSQAGLGLKNIKSRVDYLNGQLTIDSGIGGSTLIINIPIG